MNCWSLSVDKSESLKLQKNPVLTNMAGGLRRKFFEFHRKYAWGAYKCRNWVDKLAKTLWDYTYKWNVNIKWHSLHSWDRKKRKVKVGIIIQKHIYNSIEVYFGTKLMKNIKEKYFIIKRNFLNIINWTKYNSAATLQF